MSQQNKSLARSYFSTHNLLPKDRYRAWQESIGVLMDYERNERDEIEGFNAEIESFLIGDFMSADCTTNKGTWRRREQAIAADSIDMYLIQIFLKGTWEVERFNYVDKAPQGSIVISDMSRAKETHTSDFRNLSLCVPRYLLAPLLDYPDDQHLRILPGQHPLTMLLKSHMMTLHEQAPSISLDDAFGLSKPTLELIATVLNATFDHGNLHQSSILNNAKINHLKRFIDQNLQNPRLSPDFISKELGISRATLYRLSAPLGGIQNFIRKQRLLRAYKELLNPLYQNLSVLAIGMNWGFSDPSSFTRAFKAEFGVTPTELRNESKHVQIYVGNNHHDPIIGDRQYERWLAEYI